jgi:two-component system chemotaxis response regulator CheY
MIVDDALIVRVMLRDMLTAAGYHVVAEASNGIDAIKCYRKHRPDLITMDITMPEMDGISALAEIKKINDNATVIMCSAVGQQKMVLEAIQHGAKDFIVKPFQRERVIEAVQRALNG